MIHHTPGTIKTVLPGYTSNLPLNNSFSGTLRIFNFLPFSSMIYTPTMIYLGKLTGIELIKAIGIQIIWLGILIVVARVMWNTLIKKITILGG